MTVAVLFAVTACAVVALKFGLATWAWLGVLCAAFLLGISVGRRTAVVAVVVAIAGFAVAAPFVVDSRWTGIGPMIPAALLVGTAVGAFVRGRRELASARAERIRQDERLRMAQEVHELVSQLRDPVSDLDRLLDDRVEVTVIGERRPLPATVDVTVYRVVEESLANARKYGTGWVQLSMEYQPDQLVIEVRNERSGTNMRGTGYGLIGMRERVALVDGKLSAGPEGKHFVVRAVL
ncbi:hypothetical protein LWC34_34915 [Kibdelosporangium philippinense]|uniref:histidine kinase n=1 Tax=Kibdelosporangium philippinense TaxID=211113 RepID=A0ABS8ZMY2_9PSEU|nr:sensor histidine kinase [Kibdelosporangium philippinense]MCE7007976.1 hypothetical protein [Kibdelosporangium philippinense]